LYLLSYLSKFCPDATGFSDQYRELLSSTYKQFHAVLIWNLAAEKTEGKGSQTKLYYSEGVSDLSHCFLLSLMHLYKLARMALRSSIENLLRTLLFIRGVDGAKFNVVYELFTAAKTEFSGEPAGTLILQKLEMLYADLCKTVHSAKIDYMSLAVPFEQLVSFSASRYRANLNSINSVATAANRIMFLVWHTRLKATGHLNEDFVRDATPRSLKREVSSKAS
jgi:hypothetical protein